MPPSPLQKSGAGEAREVVVSKGMTVADLAKALKTSPCGLLWVCIECRVQCVCMCVLFLQGRSLKWCGPMERELTDILLVHVTS